jgi:hypothetical protein
MVSAFFDQLEVPGPLAVDLPDFVATGHSASLV